MSTGVGGGVGLGAGAIVALSVDLGAGAIVALSVDLGAGAIVASSGSLGAIVASSGGLGAIVALSGGLGAIVALSGVGLGIVVGGTGVGVGLRIAVGETNGVAVTKTTVTCSRGTDLGPKPCCTSTSTSWNTSHSPSSARGGAFASDRRRPLAAYRQAPPAPTPQLSPACHTLASPG